MNTSRCPAVVTGLQTLLEEAMRSILVTTLLVCGAAHADDAQQKTDAAKIETCEKGKKFLAEQDAKGKCKAEAAEAKKITCSASTYTQLNDLLNKCIGTTKADEKPADKPEALVPGTKCRALDPKDPKVIFEEADDKLSTKCLGQLVEKLKQKWCTDEAKGKKFEYTTEYDHVLGAGKYAKRVKGTTTSLTCRATAKK
jgi:hypothetical protein